MSLDGGHTEVNISGGCVHSLAVGHHEIMCGGCLNSIEVAGVNRCTRPLAELQRNRCTLTNCTIDLNTTKCYVNCGYCITALTCHHASGEWILGQTYSLPQQPLYLYTTAHMTLIGVPQKDCLQKTLVDTGRAVEVSLEQFDCQILEIRRLGGDCRRENNKVEIAVTIQKKINVRVSSLSVFHDALIGLVNCHKAYTRQMTKNNNGFFTNGITIRWPLGISVRPEAKCDNGFIFDSISKQCAF